MMSSSNIHIQFPLPRIAHYKPSYTQINHILLKFHLFGYQNRFALFENYYICKIMVRDSPCDILK